MFNFILILYPLYKTSQAIQRPCKTKKAVYEHWTNFWFLYVILKVAAYPLLECILWVFYGSSTLLLLLRLILDGILLCAYFPLGTRITRRYLILPALRDCKKWGTKFSPFIRPKIEYFMLNYGNRIYSNAQVLYYAFQ